MEWRRTSVDNPSREEENLEPGPGPACSVREEGGVGVRETQGAQGHLALSKGPEWMGNSLP
jgi:hypothetical protein